MPYAIVDLDDRGNNGCRVAMISEACYPFVGIEDEWLEKDEPDPPLPDGWPKNSYAVAISDLEALKILAAIETGRVVCIDSLGYANFGDGDSPERLRLEEFRRQRQTETIFLGAVLDHTLFTSGEISRQQYQECQQQREKQLNKI